MLARSTSLVLIVAIAAAPLICCSYGLGGPRHEAGCDAADACCSQEPEPDSQPPRPSDRPCDELCQCVCAGAVVDGPRDDQLLTASGYVLAGEIPAAAGSGLISVLDRASRFCPAPPGDNPGRMLRTRHQSLLC